MDPVRKMSVSALAPNRTAVAPVEEMVPLLSRVSGPLSLATAAPDPVVIEPLLTTVALASWNNPIAPLIAPLFVIVPILPPSSDWIRIEPLVPPLIVPALLTVPPLLRITPKRLPSIVPPNRLLTVPMLVKPLVL